MSGRRTGTRQRIVDTAMRMFVEQGYDGTSLREIAEALEVTKAALYYHFRTKEEIVEEAFAAHEHRLDGLMRWLEATGPSADRDAELLDRLDALFSGESGLVMRFGQVNRAVMSRESFGARHLELMSRVIGTLTRDAPGTEGRLRSILAFGAVVLAATGPSDDEALTLGGTVGERRAAGRRVAGELLAGLR